MIIVLSPSDGNIVAQARSQSYNFPEIFGQTYVAGEDQIPPASETENVFFIGHGIEQGKSGNAEIGDPNGAFAVDGLELWDSFRSVFPDMYQGDVYIDACYSADFADDMFSLTETFRSQSDLALGECSVFGRTGAVAGDIPPPGDDSWRLAEV